MTLVSLVASGTDLDQEVIVGRRHDLRVLRSEFLESWRSLGDLGTYGGVEETTRWREEERLEKEAEARRLAGARWNDDSMEVDDEGSDEFSEATDDETESEQVKELKVKVPSGSREFCPDRCCRPAASN